MRKSFHEQLVEAEGLVVDTVGIVLQQRERILARLCCRRHDPKAMRCEPRMVRTRGWRCAAGCSSKLPARRIQRSRNTDRVPLLRVQLDDVPIGHGVIGAYLLAVELSASPDPREL